MRCWAGSRLGRAATSPRGVGGGHAGHVGELTAVTESRLLRLRRGRSGSEMVEDPSAGCGPWVVARAIPPAVDPDKLSRPPPDPPASEPVSRSA